MNSVSRRTFQCVEGLLFLGLAAFGVSCGKEGGTSSTKPTTEPRQSSQPNLKKHQAALQKKLSTVIPEYRTELLSDTRSLMESGERAGASEKATTDRELRRIALTWLKLADSERRCRSALRRIESLIRNETLSRIEGEIDETSIDADDTAIQAAVAASLELKELIASERKDVGGGSYSDAAIAEAVDTLKAKARDLARTEDLLAARESAKQLKLEDLENFARKHPGDAQFAELVQKAKTAREKDAADVKERARAADSRTAVALATEHKLAELELLAGKYPGDAHFAELVRQARAAKASSATVTIQASNSSFVPVISVKKGQSYDIVAEGTWCCWPEKGSCDPDGKRYEYGPFSGFVGYAEGRIGPRGTPFKIGKRFVLVAAEDGELQVRMNDRPLGPSLGGDVYRDNSGSAEVSVRPRQ